MRRVRRTQRGGGLVLGLVVLTGLITLAVAFSVREHAEMRSIRNRIEGRRAELLADAGIQYALGVLADPTIDPTLISTADAWYTSGEVGDQRFLVGRGAFRFEIVDACSFINLNTAAEEQLYRLPLTSEQIDSLLDWRSGDLNARPEGAKDEYYNSLANPYNAALRPMDTVDEVLLVKGFTPQTLYSIPQEVVTSQYLVQGGPEEQPLMIQLATVDSRSPIGTRPDGQARLDLNAASAQQLAQVGVSQGIAQAIVQRRNQVGTFTGFGDVLLLPGMNINDAAAILDNCRVGEATTQVGRINVNTASEAVLNSIPGFTPDISSAMASRQQSGGLQTLGELTTIPGLTPEVLASSIDLLALGSQTFVVRVIGQFGSRETALEAVVEIVEGQPVLRKVRKPALPEVYTLWRWNRAPTADVGVWGNS
ncbi:MAG: type II secretion system protein GspK [Fimbriimonadaceae bacterium]|nr:MAG: type II secretion system protein GspK [Fimbriimonadaceae bacterium]